MKWYEISIFTIKEKLDYFSLELINLGANGTNIIDSEELKDYLANIPFEERSTNLHEKNSVSVVKAYYSIDEDINKLIKSINDLNEFNNDKVVYLVVDDIDWKDNWKKYFKTFFISEHIRIVPLWDIDTLSINKYDVILEPGMAFGVGTHETTRMCAKLLDKYIKLNDEVIDIGCGTGILSIISKKLGAKNVYAIDLDNKAIRATKENIIINNTLDIKVIEGELSNLDNNHKADIIVVNIIADTIIELAPIFKKYLKTNALVICSGIILSKKNEVKKTLIKNGFIIKEIVHDNEWVAIVLNA